MTSFEQYFLMKNTDITQYVKSKTNFFKDSCELSCEEIGDGNLNYVYRVRDIETGRSLIVKQAGNEARISADIKLSTDRNKIESNILMLHGEYVPNLVPKVYLYDEIMSCCVMEDLSDHTILREGLLSHEIYPQFSEHITSYMVGTLLPTTDVVMEHKEKKQMVKNYINPELCEITEDLVYTEPYNDCNHRNSILEKNKKWVEDEIYNDRLLKLEVAKLKFEFMNHAQALVHGDLHTGSIFVKKDSTKVIDPEFAFYGPIGYDVGNVIANLIFAYLNGEAHKNLNFIKWVEDTITNVIDLFKDKFCEAWDATVTDIMAKEEGFLYWYLNNILDDTAGVAGLELIRRIVGLAKVKDITSIKNEADRIRAERIGLTLAKRLIIDRSNYKNGASYTSSLQNVIYEVDANGNATHTH